MNEKKKRSTVSTVDLPTESQKEKKKHLGRATAGKRVDEGIRGFPGGG